MLQRKAGNPKKLRRAFMEKNRNYDGAYSYGRMVLCVGELKRKGYFWSGEWAGEREQCMEFVHFLTGDKKYLRFRYTSAEEQRGKRLYLSLEDQEPVCARSQEADCAQSVGAEYPMLSFAKIMDRLGLCLKEGELTPVDDIALREKDTDSLLTVLAKSRLVQKRTGKDCLTTDGMTVAYWVGEFADEKAGEGEASYVYLVQCHTVENPPKLPRLARKNPHSQVDWYVMKARVPLNRIRTQEGVTILLEEMKWLNRPFPRYYDLPVTEPSVIGEELESCMPERAELERILGQLKADGYQFYREKVYLSMEDTELMCGESLDREEEQAIMSELGVRAEYADCGIGTILMEFVRPETLERQVVSVDTAEMSVILDNSCVGYHGIYTPWFSMGNCNELNYYGDETDGVQLFYQRAMVFPEPVLLEALQKYQLITEECLAVCRLMGARETRSWFEAPWELPEYEPAEKKTKAISRTEVAKADKVRAMAEALHYSHVEMWERDNGEMIEIHANAEGCGAICLIERGGMYVVKYVNEYMDVERALG